MSGLKKTGPSRKPPKRRPSLEGDARPGLFGRKPAAPSGARVPDDLADYFSWEDGRPADRSRHVRG